MIKIDIVECSIYYVVLWFYKLGSAPPSLSISLSATEVTTNDRIVEIIEMT